jgi:hypothetical protein
MKATRFAAASVLLLTLALITSGLAQEEGEAERPRPRRPGAGEQYRQYFGLPGVTFSEEQQKKVNELRAKYTPKLADLQRRNGEVETPEQRQARRQAMEAAREAGKPGREQQAAAEAAVQLTDEQRRKRAELQREQRTLLAEIRGDLQALLTAEQKAALRGALSQRDERGPEREGAAAATHRDVQYGPHDRNVMDVWLAKSESPAPVLVSIHGGGFRGGNKGVEAGLLRECLESGISVVAITYRLSGEAIAPAPFLDSARAIQFIRHKAGEWNIDPKRIAATGGSAGAGLSLWLGFHDDLADTDNEDPVLRQSTRLSCMSVYNGQTSYDPRFIRDLLPGSDTYKHPALQQLYDIDINELDDLPAAKYKLMEETAPLTHVTKDDPPAMLSYASQMDTPIRNQGIGIHHPKFAQVLKEKMDKLGIECHIHTRLTRGSDEWTQQTMRFIKQHLGVK